MISKNKYNLKVFDIFKFNLKYLYKLNIFKIYL